MIDKEKAKRGLKLARQHLHFLRIAYIVNERESKLGYDDYILFYHCTLRKQRRKDILLEMKVTKDRIAKYERKVM